MRTLPPAHSPATLVDLIVSGGASLGASNADRLSQALRLRFDGDDVVLTSSGTHALQATLRLVADSAHSPCVVGLPSYSCYDLVTAALGAGVRVRFYDVDPSTLAPDREDFERVLRTGVQAIVAANLYAFPLPIAELIAGCRAHGAVLIEDAAQGIGASRPAEGAGPDATILSFGRGKGWTGGGGGAAVLRGALAAGTRLPGTGGRGTKSFVTATLAWLLGRPALFGIPSALPWLGVGETHFKAPTEVVPPSAFSTHLVSRTTQAAWDAVQHRRSAARAWSSALADLEAEGRIRLCTPLPKLESGFLRYPVLAASAAAATEMYERGRRFGVARGYPIPLPRLEPARSLLDTAPPRMAGSEELAACLVTLPTHHWVRDADRRSVVELFASV